MKRIKRSLSVVVIVLFTSIGSLTVWADTAVREESDAGKLVKVGCVDIDNFWILTEEGYTGGYAVDYLDEIAEHTGWEYEYVRGSWAECMEWLEEGEIDLLLPAEYSSERGELFLFSDEMCCMDYAALVGRKEDDLYYEDYEAFDGMKVGMISGNYLNGMFDSYAENHGFTVEKVFYPTGSEENAALENGEVDAIISGNMNFYESQKLLARIDFMPAYFITSKNKPQLMEQLNEAQNAINLESPYYTASLHEKYYGRIERQAVGFTREEVAYMQNVGPIQVRYDPDNYPLYYQDEETGEATGIYEGIIRQIFEGCGLKFESVPWTEEEEDWAQSIADTSNSVFCVADSLKGRKKDEMNFTDGFFTVTYNLVGKRGVNLDLQTPLKVAVISSNQGERVEIEQRYPNWEIVPAKNVKECLECVADGRADLAFVNSLVQEAQSGSEIGTELINISADIVSVDICLAMGRENEILLKTILDKGIKKLDTQEVEQSVFSQILMAKPKLTFQGIIRTYPVYAIKIVAVICIILIILSGVIMYNLSSRKKNRILQKKNQELEDAIQVQHKLQLECEQDSLTGLKNKRAVQKSCEAILREEGREACALFVLDIDNFKNINDEYGHLEGDRILTELAACIGEVFEGRIVGRIGGDEFLVFAKGMEEGVVLESVLEQFFERLQHIDLPEGITCSVGVAISKSSDDKYHDLFEKADQALYEAKRKGKNRYIIS